MQFIRNLFAPRFSRCAANCRSPGIWREDHKAHLCDTHAEIDSYAPKAPGFMILDTTTRETFRASTKREFDRLWDRVLERGGYPTQVVAI
jgi:hypothetical protein